MAALAAGRPAILVESYRAPSSYQEQVYESFAPGLARVTRYSTPSTGQSRARAVQLCAAVTLESGGLRGRECPADR